MSTMFRGQFEHAIDAKGRTSLPSRFRDVLAAANDSRLVLTPRALRSLPAPLPDEGVGGARGEDRGAAAVRPERRRVPAALPVRRRRVRARQAGARSWSRRRCAITPSSRRTCSGRAWGSTAELWSKERWQAAQAMTEAELAELQDRDRGAVPPMNVVNIVPMRLPPPPPRPRAEPHVTRAPRARRVAALAPAARRRLRRRDARRAAATPRRSSRSPGTRVIGVDRDESALALAARAARALRRSRRPSCTARFGEIAAAPRRARHRRASTGSSPTSA